MFSKNASKQQHNVHQYTIMKQWCTIDFEEHTAKFGSYTMMELQTNTIVDIQLVQVNNKTNKLFIKEVLLAWVLHVILRQNLMYLLQSNEVGGGFHMEKEGLKRSLELMEARGVTLDCIVTDRHPQVQKFLTEKNVTQFYDVWHIEKGI